MKYKLYLKKKKRKKIFWFNGIIKVINILFISSFLAYLINDSNNIFRISFEKEIENIEKYLELCKNLDKKLNNFTKTFNNPKVSIISPIYNRGKYLLRFLKSIQYQNFNDIEIILIDDNSTDNTTELIKKYKNIDNRIILIKNKKNCGTFKSRNIGILASSGEYSIIPDPDDILSQNSLKMFYAFATKNNYEMLRFNIYMGNNRTFLQSEIKKIKSRPVFRPEIQTYLYYAKGTLCYIDFNVSNKFIKREALIKALNLLGKEYLNIYMTTSEDQLLNFILYRTVNSFYFLKKIGYYYIINQQSITSKGFSLNNIKNLFIHLKFLFLLSKNNLFEKNMFNILFRNNVIGRAIINKIKMVKENDVGFFINTIDLFLENEFVSIKNKNYMIDLRNKLYNIQRFSII